MRDNEQNKRDADANKVIALLQMTFLPITAVASIFSLSQPYSWPSYWAFWLLTAVVSAGVVAVYLLSGRYQKVKEDREKEEADAKENEENEKLYQPPVPDQSIKPSKSPARQRRGRPEASRRDPGHSKGNEKWV